MVSILNFKSRRGNAVLDSILFVVIIVILGIVVIFGKMFSDVMTVDLIADDDLSNTSKDVLTTANNRYVNVFDSIFVGVLVLFWIVLLVASFNIDAHPIFFAVTVILMIFVIMLGGFGANMYEEVTFDDELSSYESQFPMTHFIMSHFLAVIIIIGFSVAVMMFAKTRMGG